MANAILAASGIYAITNILNGKRYIGSAVRFDYRWGKHRSSLSNGNHHSAKLQRAWDKYGANAFQFLVLEIATRERLLEREQFWIDSLKAANDYNVRPTAGSALGMMQSEETKAKIRAALVGRVHDPARVEKMRQGKTGKKHSLDAVEKKRMTSKGRRHTPESIQKMRERKHRPESIAKMTGKPRPEEVKRKISEGLRRRYESLRQQT